MPVAGEGEVPTMAKQIRNILLAVAILFAGAACAVEYESKDKQAIEFAILAHKGTLNYDTTISYYMFEIEGMPCVYIWSHAGGLSCDWSQYDG